MTWKPLPGRVIVTREQQLTSKVLHIIATDERGAKLADRGRVIAVGDPPTKLVRCYHCNDDGAACDICDSEGWNIVEAAERLPLGADVFYLGPEERLAIEWEGQKAYAVSYDEVLGVIENG